MQDNLGAAAPVLLGFPKPKGKDPIVKKFLLAVALLVLSATPAYGAAAPALFSSEPFEQACQDYPASLPTYELKHYTLSEDDAYQYCMQQEPMESGGNFYVWHDKATGEVGQGVYYPEELRQWYAERGRAV